MRSEDDASLVALQHVDTMLNSSSTNPTLSRGFCDLIVWQRANQLAMECDRLAGLVWATRRRAMADQLIRAAVSVSSNIAEGHGRTSYADNARHQTIARGSVREVESLLEYFKGVSAMRDSELGVAMGYADEVARMLTVMIKKHGTRNLTARGEAGDEGNLRNE